MTLFEEWFANNTPHDGTVNKNTLFTYQFVEDAFYANDMVFKLREQIEKMKCCANCRFEYKHLDENREKCCKCRRSARPYSEWELDPGIRTLIKMNLENSKGEIYERSSDTGRY